MTDLRTPVARALNRLAARIAPPEPNDRKAEWMADAMTARGRWEVAPPAWAGMAPAGVLPDGRAYWTGVDMADDTREVRQEQALTALNLLVEASVWDETISMETRRDLARTIRAAL